MDARETSFTFIKNQNIFKIPFFQRGYVWKKQNWSDLLDELKSSKKDCFLGAIILKETNQEEEGCSIKSLIDGQQRLTTLSILVRAINDDYNKRYNNSGLDNEYLEYLYFKKTIRTERERDEKLILKLRPSKADIVTYKNIIEGLYEHNYLGINDEKGLLGCYAFFREELALLTTGELTNIWDKLSIDDRKIIVRINLDKEENEQVIFDTINSAGVKLTRADIIKNALYQKIYLDEGMIETDNYEFYNSTWFEHFEKDNKLDEWLATKVTGRITRTAIDMFLQCYAIIKGFYNPQEHNLDILDRVYKEKLDMLTKDETIVLIKEMMNYADVYYDNFLGFSSTTGFIFNDQVKRLLHILKETEVSTFDAFVLRGLKEWDVDTQNREFKKLETYIMRNYLIGNTTKIKNYNKESMEFLNGTSDFNTKLADPELSDFQVRNSMKKISSNDKAKLILFWIQLHRFSNDVSDIGQATLVYNYEVEHIMPQKWRDSWNLSTVPLTILDSSHNELSIEQQEETRERAIYQIGNMTLLNSKLNKTLSNRSFSEKVKGAQIGRKKQPGMKSLCGLSLTKEVTDLPSWDENSIYTRTANLTAEFISIWSV